MNLFSEVFGQVQFPFYLMEGTKPLSAQGLSNELPFHSSYVPGVATPELTWKWSCLHVATLGSVNTEEPLPSSFNLEKQFRQSFSSRPVLRGFPCRSSCLSHNFHHAPCQLLSEIETWLTHFGTSCHYMKWCTLAGMKCRTTGAFNK